MKGTSELAHISAVPAVTN